VLALGRQIKRFSDPKILFKEFTKSPRFSRIGREGGVEHI
jgi:hypothetical protein